jgi:hypothetical protein
VLAQARTAGDVATALTAAGVAGDHVKVAKAALAVRWTELTAALTRESVAVGGNRITDFDWTVRVRLSPSIFFTLSLLFWLTMHERHPKVTQASSKVASMQEPRLALRLTSAGAGAAEVELTLPELRTLLASLEAAQTHVRALSSA